MDSNYESADIVPPAGHALSTTPRAPYLATIIGKRTAARNRILAEERKIAAPCCVFAAHGLAGDSRDTPLEP